MRKLKKGKKFNRKGQQRKALFKTLARSFILKEKIETTEAKAKELRPFIEKCITKAKSNNLSARRQLLKSFSERTVKKLIEEIAPRYEKRKGGYTRIVKMGRRISDGAKKAVIELVK